MGFVMILRMFFNVFLPVFLLFSGLYGPAVYGEEQQAKVATPALWLAEKDQSKVYFLGSFHLLPPELQWYSDKIKAAFESADEVVLETVLTPQAQQEIQGMVLANMAMPPGETLAEYMKPEELDKLAVLAAPLGLGPDQLNGARPWFLALQLSITSIINNGFDPEAGVDKKLEKAAFKAGKTVSGLETSKDQMNALINHPLELQARMLADTVDKMADFEVYMDSYLNAWSSGDTQQIADTMVAEMKVYLPMYEALLVNRNKKWLPRIEFLLNKQQTTMIIVGTAHLVGEDSVIKMLEDKGYVFKRVQ